MNRRRLVTLLLTGTALTALACLMGPVAHAAAVHTATWWDHRTCYWFATWRRHHTPALAGHVAYAARHAHQYLRTDAAGWIAHHMSHVWSGYLHADCTTGPDQ